MFTFFVFPLSKKQFILIRLYFDNVHHDHDNHMLQICFTWGPPDKKEIKTSAPHVRSARNNAWGSACPAAPQIGVSEPECGPHEWQIGVNHVAKNLCFTKKTPQQKQRSIRTYKNIQPTKTDRKSGGFPRKQKKTRGSFLPVFSHVSCDHQGAAYSTWPKAKERLFPGVVRGKGALGG